MLQKKSSMYVHRGKKGISPLIASVLVIGMVVVTASIVFFWGKGFTEEIIEKEGAVSTQRLNCATDVKINVLSENSGLLTIENAGSGRVDAFSLVVDGVAEEQVVSIEPGNTQQIASSVQPGQKVDIIPKIRIGAGVFQPCSSQKVTYKV
ncbi:MAG: hypothetical protein Q8L34_06290 [Candidatus Woesearchaeota archaeon]|nr:hypothetical protein [Candidatus Woesearchaeota archaeon]